MIEAQYLTKKLRRGQCEIGLDVYEAELDQPLIQDD